MAPIVKHGFTYKGKFVRPTVPLTIPDPKKAKKLWAHQERFFRELKNSPYWFVVAPPAAGKSLTISVILHTKLKRDKKLRAIIAVPQTIIGDGFEDCKFKLANRKKDISFAPKLKLHKGAEQTNQEALRSFLTKSPTSPVRDRVVICTHQTLVRAYKKFPKLFKKVLVVVDEAHHSKAAEDEVMNNCLGHTVTDLIRRRQQVGLATATASRGDGVGLMGKYKDKFKVSECPFDEYLKVCRWFRNFTFDFVLYEDDYVEAVDQLLGDKRTRPPRTIIHIPNVHSGTSNGKHVDRNYVYAGIAGSYEVEVENEDGDGDGITLIRRGRRWIRVVDLVNEKNRALKKQVITEAHEDPDNSRIDVIIALNMFKEGANWRWAEKSIIIGYRGSFVELTQMVGRGLRDAPDKESAAVHYLLPTKQDPTDDQADALNDYLKALLFVLLLEDDFEPVQVREQIKNTGKYRMYKTDLLSEAVGFDTSEKLRIEQLIMEELLQHDELSWKRQMELVVEVLESEGVQHRKVPVGMIAKQVLKAHKRRSKTVLDALEQDTKRFKVGDVDFDLIAKSKHPLAYLQYYTEAIGAGTLGALRTALADGNEERWWKMYGLLKDFVADFGKLPQSRAKYKGVPLASWCATQRYYKTCGKLTLERQELLATIPGWSWSVRLSDMWADRYEDVRLWISKYGAYPSSTSINKTEARLGRWCNTQRGAHRRNKLTVHRIRKLESIPGWWWEREDKQ